LGVGVDSPKGWVSLETHSQVGQTGTPDQVRLSGLPDSVCLHQV
jgi:hypothetical protein